MLIQQYVRRMMQGNFCFPLQPHLILWSLTQQRPMIILILNAGERESMVS